jgi:signal transduction histidine kinase
MRPVLKGYVGLVVVAALALLWREIGALPSWSHPWSIEVVLALLVLSVLGEHVQFEVRRGWYTNCSAVAHIAAAFLLPPALAMSIAAIGAAARGVRYPLPPAKLAFNAAAISLAVLGAAHIAGLLGGPDLVQSGGAWSDPLAAMLASTAYYALSASMVALAVALDQRRSFFDIVRGKFGFRSVSEVGLGMVGAMLAAMLSSAPNWAPMLVVPAGLLYFAKRSMDRADRRSRNLAVTSSVGRAVAGTLDPERAFGAITSRTVLDGLKLDGLAVLPIGDPSPFGEQVVAELDRPRLRSAVVRELAERPRLLEVRGGDSASSPRWLSDVEEAETHVAAVAIPFGAGAGRAVGALVAWRGLPAGRSTFLNREELLVLETLADYAAVAFETARLANETARLHHEAGQAEAQREMEALREVARLKDEFLGQVSHELRTPLTIIHGYSELMVDGMLDDQDLVRQSASEINASSALMMRLVDDLLDTSRLDAGRIELKCEPMNLTCWLERMSSNFGQAVSTHRVIADVPAWLPTVSADAHRLGQVMNNLLSNAVRYSAAGTPIVVRALALADGGVEIQVTDRGPGIAPADHERIFEKFYRGKHGATLAVRGTGLGLAVARQIVEAHHGRIGVTSAVGEGSTFWVRLPALGAPARHADGGGAVPVSLSLPTSVSSPSSLSSPSSQSALSAPVVAEDPSVHVRAA